jgi:hypothetical protein
VETKIVLGKSVSDRIWNLTSEIIWPSINKLVNNKIYNEIDKIVYDSTDGPVQWLVSSPILDSLKKNRL